MGAVLLVLAADGVVVRRRVGRIKQLHDLVALLPCGCDEEQCQGGEEKKVGSHCLLVSPLRCVCSLSDTVSHS